MSGGAGCPHPNPGPPYRPCPVCHPEWDRASAKADGLNEPAPLAIRTEDDLRYWIETTCAHRISVDEVMRRMRTRRPHGVGVTMVCSACLARALHQLLTTTGRSIPPAPGPAAGPSTLRDIYTEDFPPAEPGELLPQLEWDRTHCLTCNGYHRPGECKA